MAKTALVVDDSASIRQMVTYTLQQAGFQVIEGADGQDALDKLDRSDVQVIITDLNMPVMDGLSLIRHIRTRPAHKFTPVLMLTTESSDDKKREARAAGATGWIVKPFSPQQLVQVVAKVLP